MRNEKIKDITLMAMYLALFVGFDWLSNQVPFFKMPNGGTLGIGVIPLILSSYHLGWKKGVLVCMCSVLLMFMTGQMYIIQNSDGFSLLQILAQFLMEYPIAFGVYGLSSIFPNKNNVYTGIIISNLIRLALHTVAGTIFWSTPWWGSFTYNAWYMIPTMIVSAIIVPILIQRLNIKTQS